MSGKQITVETEEILSYTFQHFLEKSSRSQINFLPLENSLRFFCMKCQSLFSEKNKNNISKVTSAKFFIHMPSVKLNFKGAKWENIKSSWLKKKSGPRCSKCR